MKTLQNMKRQKGHVSVRILTEWRLQHASVLLTVAYWLDLRGVHEAPEVVLVVRPVQAQPQPRARQAHHCGDAGGRGVPWVQGFQLHPCLELVERRREALDVDDRRAFSRERAAT